MSFFVDAEMLEHHGYVSLDARFFRFWSRPAARPPGARVESPLTNVVRPGRLVPETKNITVNDREVDVLQRSGTRIKMFAA